MSASAIVALGAVCLVGVVSAVIGSFGVRVARSTSDFLVASRTVRPAVNAAAISGEYLSAAAFLGIAGEILRQGADALWYPVAFVAGYLGLVLFVAAPMRRSGAYTVPDFAQVRLPSAALRRVCTVFVLVIGWLYLLPQLQAAGLALTVLSGLPTAIGVAGAGVVVVLIVAGGGMRSITFVQAFQYWLKVVALAIPALVVFGLFVRDGRTFDRPVPPVLAVETTVRVDTPVVLQVEQPTPLTASGTVDGRRLYGPVVLRPGRHAVASGTTLRMPAGTQTPTPVGTPATDEAWLAPTGDGQRLLEIYSILVAGFLGTMGLPQVLVRFYTSADGRAARRTTVGVLALIGGFYVAVVLIGALSRMYAPQLLLSGETDAAVLLVPTGALGGGWLGWALSGLVAAGAAAAFLSTSSGLVVSLAGVLSTDVLTGRRLDFRVAAMLATAVPLGAALTVARLDFALTVPLVFAVAASTFCPLLVLGIWWRGLTAPGAVAGILAGGGLATLAALASLAGWGAPGPVGVLVARPALVSVPLAFAVMTAVSYVTRARVPAGVDGVLLRLHAPERLGLGTGGGRPDGRGTS